MTPPLRRAHRTIWLLLAVALPVGFTAALRATKPPLLQEPIARQPPAPLPVLGRSVATNSIVVHRRQAGHGADKQLEMVVKRSKHTSSHYPVNSHEDLPKKGVDD